MDGYEATRMVFSRIQSIDPDNASKIMGLLFIQDHGEKEMIRLAFGPETLLHSVVLKARKELGLPSNSPSTPLTPSSPSPFLSTNPTALSRQSSRLISTPNAGGGPSWATTLSDSLQSNNEGQLVDASSGFGGLQGCYPASIYGNSSGDSMIDDFQLPNHLSFLKDGSHHPLDPNSTELLCQQSDMMSSVHRRSCSMNDMSPGSEDPCLGIGWKPCLYYARGFCKNGSSCRFLHDSSLGDSVTAAALMGGVSDCTSPVVGSPSKVEMMGQYHELLRSKSALQQRVAAASQLMGGSTAAFPFSPKSLNVLLQQQQSDAQRTAAALMMGEDIYKYGRSRLERNDFSVSGMASPASRQIYLTFPADSTFKEEDVSNYFSNYGPVQDVRIPYQQKRMFGFVTFVYPETVKLILAKGNPHFVCDARVLVKPYKEKGKAQDKCRKQQQQGMERGDFSPCGTPIGLDSRGGPLDLQLGSRSFYSSQEALWRRKLEEQAELQQAIELQSQRLLSLHLDMKKHHHHRALSTGSSIPSPTQPSNLFNQTFILPPIGSSRSVQEDNGTMPTFASLVIGDNRPIRPIATPSISDETINNNKNANGEKSSHTEDGDINESLEHNLPDSPFASSTKSFSGYTSAAITVMVGENNKQEETMSASPPTSNSNNLVSPSLIPATSDVDMASFKSFNCQMPGFFSGLGAMGMYAGASGPTYPVGV
ncbi:hypothetical protein SAY87_031138 [Trapa incisa]|uniref:Zinc finger CCCH domain-containing protein 53-like n=1 Tax=Trapa incisa TaxID=236973 RepID=A0AAN7KNT3_9MYRT|nr:hypothetical protein SAY87_031138 [Trapa incisa]